MLFWGAPYGSPNPGPISDQKKVIFHTSFQNLPLKPIRIFGHGGGHKTQYTCFYGQKLCHQAEIREAPTRRFLKIHFDFA